MHAGLGSYSRFMADDYCSAAESLRLGILRAAWFWYRTWTGRYSASVLDAAFGALGPGFTPAVTALVLIVWMASLFAAILLYSRSTGGHAQPLLGFSIAGVVLFLTLALAPSVPQALYWGQGMRSVIPPLIVMALDTAIFLFARERNWPRWEAILWMALSFMMAFGAGGFSETYAALQVVILGLALAMLFFARERNPRRQDALFLSTGLAGAILAVVVVIASPGNPARAANFPPAPGLLDLLRISFESYGIFLSQLVSSPLKVTALAASLTFGIWAGLHSAFGPRGWRVAVIIAAAGLVLTFSCFPPAAYGESTVPPDRTLLIPTYMLVLAAVLVGAAVSGPLAERWKPATPLSYASILLLWIAAILSLHQMLAVRPTYIAYARAWGQFHSQMIGFRREGIASAVISTADMKANNWAQLNTLGDNTRFWLNKCVGDYYGVKVISATP
jgi:hypothetical protein